MKKTILLLMMIVLLTGCTVKSFDDIGYKNVATDIIDLNVKYYNTIGNGYKYFKPKGVVRTYSKNYNDVLKRENINYYLYVDVVSYYYKEKQSYKKDNSLFYYDNLSKNGKQGYITVKKTDNKNMLVTLYYNYSKIQSNVPKDDLKQVILDMSYIVSSMNFNDSLLKKMYEKGELSSKDEVFKLFDNKNKEGNFLEYIMEYDKYDETNMNEEVELKTTTTTTTTKIEEQTTTTTKQEETTTSN